MNNFISCVLKDLKIFGRSKFSAIVAALVPLLIVLLVGAAFSSTELQGVKVSAYSSSYSELTDSIISNFEKQSFKVSKEESSDKCTEAVKSGNSQICVIFPPDLSSEGNAESVAFHVDKSRINLAYVLIEEVRNEVSYKSSELSLDLVNDLILTLQEAKTSLEAQKTALSETSSEVDNIKTKANSVAGSVPNLNGVSTKVNEALKIANDINGSTSLKSQLNSAIEEINSISASITEVSKSANDIGTESSSVKTKVLGISSSIDETILKLNSIKVTEAEKIVSPIKTEIKSVVDESTNWAFIFPTLLALMILFGSTILASVMALRDKQSRAYFRNFITPTTDLTFLVAMYVSSIIILIVQLIVLFSGLVLITDLSIAGFIGNLALVLFISCTTFIFLGIFIGHLFKSEEAVILVAISVISLMLFFSNTILPVESILGSFQQIAAYNPLVVSSSMLKKTILFDQGITSMLPELYILLAAFVLFFVFAYIARKATSRLI